MMHRAVVMSAPSAPLPIEEYLLPVLEPGTALLRTLYPEICGRDAPLYQGHVA